MNSLSRNSPTAENKVPPRATLRRQLRAPSGLADNHDQSASPTSPPNPGPDRRPSARASRSLARRGIPSPPRLPNDDPPTPPPLGTEKVKLELQPRPDAELAAFGESHVAAMRDNPWFVTPMPSPDVFDAELATFESLLAELDILRLRVKNLTDQKDRSRQRFEALFTQRGAYVQLVSNGNGEAIASSGLAARRPRTRSSVLPSPQGLRVQVTQSSGELRIRWFTVPGARTYILECAEIIAHEPLTWTQIHVGGKLSCTAKQLTPGHRYAFRLAALGGSEGRSPWSPVVERMAA